MVSIKVSHLYPEPWGHLAIPHPQSRKPVRLMSMQVCLGFASKILSFLRKSKADLVVVLESGVTPLARTCRLLAEKEGFSLEWRFLKVARDLEGAYYLDRSLCQSRSLVILDEYVDSGSTLRKALTLLNKLGCKDDPKVVCYAWLTEAYDLDSYLGFACYSGRKNNYWEEFGAYPYENRIDLIGYFYDEQDLLRGPIKTSNFWSSITKFSAQNCETFLLNLFNLCSQPALLQTIRARCQHVEVSRYIDLSHLMRFSIFELERRASVDTALTTMLSKLWDLYGPMWSPYPDRLHLDFWRAFEGSHSLLEEAIGFSQLEKQYRYVREPLSHQIAICLEKRREWWNKELLTVISNTSSNTLEEL